MTKYDDFATIQSLWQESALCAVVPTTLSGTVETDTCVVGLGGSGLSALGELHKRGVDAIGIDARGIGSGAAGRNGGFLLAGLANFHHDAVRQLGRERAVACYRATQRCVNEIVDALPEATEVCGSLRIATDESELADCQQQLVAMRQADLSVEEYSGPEGDGLLFPEDARIQPAAACQIGAEQLVSNGIRLFAGEPVVHIADGIVSTHQGVVRSEHVLVCVDGRLETLLPQLSGTVRSARLQMLATEPLVGGRRTARLTDRLVYSRYGYDYYQQTADGRIVLGGGRDSGADAEWCDREEPSARVQSWLDGLLARICSMNKCKVPQVTHRWAGIVGYTSSGLPVVRRLGERLYVAGGYCGTGNVIGRLAGRGLVELARDGSSELAGLFDSP